MASSKKNIKAGSRLAETLGVRFYPRVEDAVRNGWATVVPWASQEFKTWLDAGTDGRGRKLYPSRVGNVYLAEEGREDIMAISLYREVEMSYEDEIAKGSSYGYSLEDNLWGYGVPADREYIRALVGEDEAEEFIRFVVPYLRH